MKRESHCVAFGLGLVLGGLLVGLPARAQTLEAQFGISRVLGAEQSEYRAQREMDGALRLANPAHGMTARFDQAGLVLADGGGTKMRWTLVGLGYGAKLESPGAAAPRSSLNRVEYRRKGVTEWYVNGPFGIEQGFTLAAPPNRGAAGPLTVALRIADDSAALVTMRLDADRRGLTLTASSGRPLRYRGLLAVDACGRDLPASMEADGGRVLLRIDDSAAAYPLVIDPFIERGKLSASDGVGGDLFGFSVAIDGDTVVVGRPRGSAAYVFVKPPGGWASMTETAKLTASDGRVGVDFFGEGVAVSGDTVIVGAPTASVGTNLTRGAAYVFVKPAGGWTTMTETAKLSASVSAVGDDFGLSVAMSGDTVVIGAIFAKFGGLPMGAVFVFVKPLAGWTSMTETATLRASDQAVGDDLGFAVAMSGDTVVATAVRDNVGTNTLQGSAYVFVKPTGGWTNGTETAKLTASDGAAKDQFGDSIGISGDTVVVGVPRAKIGANVNQGAAYAFVKPGAAWSSMTETAKLTASDGARSDQFGDSVAISGEIVFAGASGDTIGTQFGRGSVYEFVKPTSGWATMTETDKLLASDGAASDTFGAAVATDGNTLVVGSQFGLGNQKSVYVFDAEIPVTIDIKPGSDPNSINCNNANEVITVAILTTPGFDATTVDQATVRFAGAGEIHVDKATGLPRRHVEDVDGDGHLDLVLHMRLGDTTLTCASTEGVLTGKTFGGQSIRGADGVRMVTGGGGKP